MRLATGRASLFQFGGDAADDETSSESPTVFAPDEARGDAVSGAMILSDGSAISEGVVPSPGLAALLVSFEAPAPEIVSQRLTSEAVALWDLQASASAASSTDNQVGAPAGAKVLADGDDSRGVHLAPGDCADAAGVSLEPGLVPGAITEPRYAGLAAGFLPLDRAAFERAVDRFLGQFESLATDLADFEAPGSVFTAMSIVGVGALASGVIVQKRRRSLAADETAPNDQAGFSYFTGLPHSWSWSVAKA
jgi:hypothetical protein